MAGIRAATPADFPAAARLRAIASPEAIVTAEGMALWLTGAPEHALLRMFVAEVDGTVVGWGVAMRAWHQSDPSVDTLGPQGFAANLGFVELSASSTSAVDPRTVQALTVPAGVTLVPFGELTDPRPLWELALETTRDIPGDDDFDGMGLDAWAGQFWHTIFADDEASLAAYVDGELAGLTILRVDRPSARAQNNLTGVRRAHRGRGIARLLKTHSLARAAAAGATVAITDNDERNAPMLAVNTALGYRPSSRRVEWERVVGDA